MERFEIQGGTRLEGEIQVNGAKNSALPIMAAALMGEGTSRIRGVPDLRDVQMMCQLLEALGVEARRTTDGTIEITPRDESAIIAPYELVRQMRASICVLGPILARRKRASVSMPGGCVIGVRPIDLHLRGLEALGAERKLFDGYVEMKSKQLIGGEVYLGGAFGSTVLGTGNVMMAACLAKGTTTIECAACEPEVVDLADFLNKMGAKITGAGSHRITIEGVDHLHGADHTVIPDRIEAGTFMVAAAMTLGDVTIKGGRLDHLAAVVDSLRHIGVRIDRTGSNGDFRVTGSQKYNATDVVALPYPGVPTDMQAQIAALLSSSEGISVVTDKVFPDRFMYVSELNRMGVQIRKESSSAIIVGKPRLMGAEVMASDLRASAALVLAGMAAHGRTIVHRIYHIDRGYERVEERLNAIGAQITRAEDPKTEGGSAGD